MAVFRDELRNLFPDDDYAKRLSGQVLLLREFIERHGDGFAVARLAARQPSTASAITGRC